MITYIHTFGVYPMLDKHKLNKAVNILKSSHHATLFSGAGISVESGIPTFRGKDGLWSKFDPSFLDITFFYNYPEESWPLIKKIFYSYFTKAKPNDAHIAVAKMEQADIIKTVITQNIDNLHQKAGSKNVIEFHGTSNRLICTKCHKKYSGINKIKKLLQMEPYPKCEVCDGLLKPDFVFFKENIPRDAYEASIKETEIADVFVIVGTTGEIQPASMLPIMAKRNGATIIEINIKESGYTFGVSDIFLQGKATEVLKEIAKGIV